MRAVFALILTTAIAAFGIQIAAAQTSGSETEIARRDRSRERTLAERSAKCRSEAKAKKLHFGKRRAFLRECMKSGLTG